MSKLTKRTQAYLFLFINILCWGAALPIVKLGLPFTTPFRYLLYRYFFACLFTLPLLWHFSRTLRRDFWRFIPKITILEIIGTTISLAILYVGLNKTTSLETGLIANTLPIFITIGGVLYLKEKENRYEWAGLIIAFFGTLFLTIEPLFSGGTFSFQSLEGNILIVIYNILTALYFLKAKRVYKKIPKFFVSTISFYVGVISFFFLSMWELGTSASGIIQVIASDFSHPQVWGISLYMAIFGSIIGLTAYIKGQDGIEASEASVLTYLQPFIYIPLGFFWLQEKISLFQILCVFLILAGVVIAEMKNYTKAKR